LVDGEFAVVEDRGAEDGVGVAIGDRLVEVHERAGAAGGDHRHGDRVGDRPRQRDVVAVAGAVAVHAGQQDLPRPQLDALDRPRDGLAPLDPLAAAVDVDAPAVSLALRVDRQHHALGAEVVGQLGQQLGPRQRRGVDRDLVGPRVEHRLRVPDGADSAADRERDEDVVGGPPRQLDDGVALLVRGGDVEEDQLVGALGVVALGQLDRVARVAQADEVGALHYAAGVHVQAGDYSLQDHGGEGRGRRGRGSA
jgi:hypothetical protein